VEVELLHVWIAVFYAHLCSLRSNIMLHESPNGGFLKPTIKQWKIMSKQ